MLTLSIRRRKTLRPDITQEGELEHQTTVPCGITSVPMHLGQQEPHACIVCLATYSTAWYCTIRSPRMLWSWASVVKPEEQSTRALFTFSFTFTCAWLLERAPHPSLAPTHLVPRSHLPTTPAHLWPAASGETCQSRSGSQPLCAHHARRAAMWHIHVPH